MERLNRYTKEILEEKIAEIRKIFPEVFSEGYEENGNLANGIDFEKLKQELSHFLIDSSKERYQMTWPGKREAIVTANAPTDKTLRPLLGKSVNFETTKNIYIEGDNLEALKILRETYLGKVKMIYIDPPYNTGHDFIYQDNFSVSDTEFMKATNDIDESGNRMRTNPNTNGRFHTNWLNMIYPRLKIAKDFLTEDGAFFISIDENELGNLIKICDEIFGEKNKVSVICNKARASISNDKIISQSANYILFYACDIDSLFEKRKVIGLNPNLSGFDLNDNDGNGFYKLVPVDGPGGARKGNPYFEFLGVEGYFRFSKLTMERMYKENLIVKKGNSLYQKYYLNKAKDSRRTATNWWDDVGLTSSATSKLKDLMGVSCFDNPKPVDLVLRMLEMITFDDKLSIIMDFFSGSATTAHAVMKMNSEDGGKRKFILIQVPEPCEKDSVAFNAGFHNICEIGEKRILRAAEKISNERPLETANADLGMRVFEVESSNFKTVDEIPATYSLTGKEDNIKDDRNELDLVFQSLLDLGFPLSSTIAEHSFKNNCGGGYFVVNDGDMICCFAKNIDESEIEELASAHPLYAVFRDSSFADDSASVNCEQIFKTISPTTKIKVL